MVKLFVDYCGDLHCRIKHEPSGASLETDAPVDNQGKGESFSPTDLVAGALSSCIATTLAIFSKKHQWNLTGMRLEVNKEMVTAPMRRIGRLPVEIWMPINLPEKDRKFLEKVANDCPVHQSLSAEIESPITFHWPV